MWLTNPDNKGYLCSRHTVYEFILNKSIKYVTLYKFLTNKVNMKI
jgi:hypothetical protein